MSNMNKFSVTQRDFQRGTERISTPHSINFTQAY